MHAYVRVTGFVFGVVALLHAARLVFDWPVQIAQWRVPQWLSWLAIVLAGAICIWAYRLTGAKS